MTETIHKLRSKMKFFGYRSKNLDAIELAFSSRFGNKPKAYMARSPFMIRGRKENRKKLIISQKHCGANAVFVPLILGKIELEETILALGEVQKTIYVDRRKIENAAKLAEIQAANRVATYKKHCQHCGKIYETGVVRPAPHCGSAICHIRHKEYLAILKERRAESKEKAAHSVIEKDLPSFSLENPAHNTLQGYVYFIQAENGLVKIGRSDDVEKRFSALRTMSPIPVVLLHTVFSDNYVLAESYIHQELDRYRHHGEWFDLPENIIEWSQSLDNYDLDTV